MYDKTRRVRTPSPVPLSDSEDGLPPAAKAKVYCTCTATVGVVSEPEVVAGVSEIIGEGCNSPQSKLSNTSASETTEQGGTDGDFEQGGRTQRAPPKIALRTLRMSLAPMTRAR